MIYSMRKWDIGTSFFNPIYINAKSEVTHYVGKKVLKKILGIPLVFSDYTTHDLTLDSNHLNTGLYTQEIGGK
jgi:hypothetical protein